MSEKNTSKAAEAAEKEQKVRVMSDLECRRVLSELARDDSNSPSERIKAISLLVSLRPAGKKADRDIKVCVDYLGERLGEKLGEV